MVAMLVLPPLRLLQEWIEWFLPHPPNSPQTPGRQMAISLYRDLSRIFYAFPPVLGLQFDLPETPFGADQWLMPCWIVLSTPPMRRAITPWFCAPPARVGMGRASDDREKTDLPPPEPGLLIRHS